MQDNVDVSAAQRDGVTTDEQVMQSYWGFDIRDKVYLPDEKQYVEIKKMNEGDKSKYQGETRSDITLQRNTGDARLKADPAAERTALLMSCVVGWNIVGPDGSELNFNKTSGQYSLKAWLLVADPSIIEKIEKGCRKLNSWLLNDLSVEDIDKAIDDLKDQREEAVKREAGE